MCVFGRYSRGLLIFDFVVLGISLLLAATVCAALTISAVVGAHALDCPGFVIINITKSVNKNNLFFVFFYLNSTCSNEAADNLLGITLVSASILVLLT